MSENVFVVGLDEENERVLERLPWAGTYRFHGVLTPEELQHGDIDFEELLVKAERRLDSFGGEIRAIVSYWDFPAATLVPMLCARYGLPSVPLEAVLKCEHKYWSRIEQRKVIDELPNFGIVDLDDEKPVLPGGVKFPVWLKPVKSFSSDLAFKLAAAQAAGRCAPVFDPATAADALIALSDGIASLILSGVHDERSADDLIDLQLRLLHA